MDGIFRAQVPIPFARGKAINFVHYFPVVDSETTYKFVTHRGSKKRRGNDLVCALVVCADILREMGMTNSLPGDPAKESAAQDVETKRVEATVDNALADPRVTLSAEQIEEWRKKMHSKIFEDFCGEPNESHWLIVRNSFDVLCNQALAALDLQAALKAQQITLDKVLAELAAANARISDLLSGVAEANNRWSATKAALSAASKLQAATHKDFETACKHVDEERKQNVALQARLEDAERNQHDENCDTRDVVISGKPCNCYLLLKERLEEAQKNERRYQLARN